MYYCNVIKYETLELLSKWIVPTFMYLVDVCLTCALDFIRFSLLSNFENNSCWYVNNDEVNVPIFLHVFFKHDLTLKESTIQPTIQPYNHPPLISSIKCMKFVVNVMFYVIFCVYLHRAYEICSITSAGSLAIFKKQLKTFLFRTAYDFTRITVKRLRSDLSHTPLYKLSYYIHT